MTTASDSERGRRLSSGIVQLAGAMIAAIRNDETVIARLHELTKAAGRGSQAPEVMTPAMVALVDDLTAMLIEAVLPGWIDESTDVHLADIRRFFLTPKEDYDLADLAALWRITFDDTRDFLHHEIRKWQAATHEPESSFRMSWADAVAMSTTFNLLRAFDIEVALADDFDSARSDRWRTVPLLIRLPRFIVQRVGDPTTASIRHRDLAVRVEDLFIQLYQDEYRDRADLSELDATSEESELSGNADEELDGSAKP
jgi:hypothetical protein